MAFTIERRGSAGQWVIDYVDISTFDETTELYARIKKAYPLATIRVSQEGVTIGEFSPESAAADTIRDEWFANVSEGLVGTTASAVAQVRQALYFAAVAGIKYGKEHANDHE